MSSRDNLIRWNGKERPFFEVYYLKVNDPTAGIGLWLRYTLTSKTCSAPEAAIWAIFFNANDPGKNVALKETVGIKDVVYRRGRFDINIGGAVLKNDSASGSIKQGGNYIKWELNWQPSEKGFRYYPWLLYHLPWPSSKVVAPHLSTKADGWIEINGVKFVLNSAPFHQGHIWGKELSREWAWADCSAFAEDGSAVISLIANPRLGFGYVKTSQLKKRFRIRGKYSLTGWEFKGQSFTLKIMGRIIAKPNDIIGITYQDPSGSERYCYNTKVADAVVDIYKKQKGKWVCMQRLTCAKAMAFEVVKSTPRADFRLSL